MKAKRKEPEQSIKANLKWKAVYNRQNAIAKAWRRGFLAHHEFGPMFDEFTVSEEDCPYSDPELANVWRAGMLEAQKRAKGIMT